MYTRSTIYKIHFRKLKMNVFLLCCLLKFLQNLHQLISNSANPIETKQASIVSQSPTNLHTITIRQPMIYLFGSQHTRSVTSDQSTETSAIRE